MNVHKKITRTIGLFLVSILLFTPNQLHATTTRAAVVVGDKAPAVLWSRLTTIQTGHVNFPPNFNKHSLLFRKLVLFGTATAMLFYEKGPEIKIKPERPDFDINIYKRKEPYACHEMKPFYNNTLYALHATRLLCEKEKHVLLLDQWGVWPKLTETINQQFKLGISLIANHPDGFAKKIHENAADFCWQQEENKVKYGKLKYEWTIFQADVENFLRAAKSSSSLEVSKNYAEVWQYLEEFDAQSRVSDLMNGEATKLVGRMPTKLNFQVNYLDWDYNVDIQLLSSSKSEKAILMVTPIWSVKITDGKKGSPTAEHIKKILEMCKNVLEHYRK